MNIPENKMSELLKASMEGIKSFTDMDTVVARPINTPSGVTVIPISKVAVGLATGGIDYGERRGGAERNFGGGGGSGVYITPIALLTIGRDAEIELIPLNTQPSDIDKIANLIENAPFIIEKIRAVLQ